MKTHITDNQTEAPLLTKPEAAKLIRKTTRCLETWVKRGYISHLKIGRAVLFRREQLLADLERFSVREGGVVKSAVRFACAGQRRLVSAACYVTIAALRLPAAIFWRFAAWRARVQTKLNNEKAARDRI